MNRPSVDSWPEAQADTLVFDDLSCEEICQLAENLSPIAERRLQKLANLAYDNETYGPEFGKAAITIKEFCKKYGLFYWDELVVALHQSEEAFAAFMRTQFDNNSDLCLQEPDIFQQFYPPTDDRNMLLCKAIYSSHPFKSFTYYYNLFETDADKEEYANHVTAYKYRLQSDALFSALQRSTVLSDHQKRVQILKTLESSSIFKWQGFELYRYFSQLKKWDAQSDGSLCDGIECLKQLVAENIVTVEELEASIANDINTQKPKKDRWMLQRNAASAQLTLRIAGVLPAPKDQNMIDEFVNAATRVGLNDFRLDFATLICQGYLDKDKATEIYIHYDTDHHTSCLENLTDQLIRFERIDNGLGDKLERQRNNSATPHRVNQAYQKYIVDGMDFREISELPSHHDESFYKNVLYYNGDDEATLEKMRQLCNKYYSADGNFVNLRSWSDDPDHIFTTVYAEHKNEIVPHILRSIESGESCGIISANNVSAIQRLLGLSHAQMKKVVSSTLCIEAVNPWASIQLLNMHMSCDNPLFTVQDAVEVILQIIHLNDLDDDLADLIGKFCRKVLGKKLTVAHIIPELSTHADRFISNEELLAKIDPTDDYYTVYENSVTLKGARNNKTDRMMEEHIVRYFELADEHFIKVVPDIWEWLDETQQREALNRIHRNPVLLEIYLSYSKFSYFVKSNSLNRELSNDTFEHPLEKLAPKSWATYQRRRASKTLPYAIQKERVNAESPHPRALEAQLGNLLIHYSYVTDLCIRLENFNDTPQAIYDIRGKNTEKNEVTALELLVLLHELCGVDSYEDIVMRSTEDLSDVALLTLFSQVGLSDAESVACLESLLEQRIDKIKFGMWLHQSFRSKKLHTYLGSFLHFLANGHSVADWKLAYQVETLRNEIDPSIMEQWVSEYEEVLPLNGRHYTMRFTNDLNRLLLCGMKPVANCLHYSYGTNQHALVGLLASDAKLISLDNENDQPVANAIIRIMTDTTHKKPLLVIEPIYGNMIADEFEEVKIAFVLAAERYAHSIGMELHITRDKDVSMYRTLEKLWGNDFQETQPALMHSSTVPFSYVDNTGIRSKRNMLYGYRKRNTTNKAN